MRSLRIELAFLPTLHSARKEAHVVSTVACNLGSLYRTRPVSRAARSEISFALLPLLSSPGSLPLNALS